MAFWSSERIRAEQNKHPLIEPSKFKPEHVKYGAYELTLSREVLSAPDGTADPTSANQQSAVKIAAGQFAFLYTEEQVSIPKNAISLISIKASIKFRGLINISGFHVDPGFSGRLKFAVYNASGFDVHVNYGEPCFLIWFADLDSITKDAYAGEHQGQRGISNADRDWMMKGPNLSPAELSKKFRELENDFDLIKKVGATAFVTVIAPIFVGIIILLVQHFVENSKTAENQKSPSQLQMNAYGVPAQIYGGTNQPVISQTHANPNATAKTNSNP